MRKGTNKSLTSGGSLNAGGSLLTAPACQPYTVQQKKEAIQALRSAHLAYLRSTSTMPDEELQSIAKNHTWTDKTANGLTKMIVGFLDYSGHYANRINTQGQAVVSDVQRYNVVADRLDTTKKVSYRPGTTKKGTSDISGTVNGRAVYIEVKIGKDRMSKEQIKQKEKIERAGGLYYIARDFLGFYTWYLSITKQETI